MVSTVFFSDFLEICNKKSEVHPKQTKWQDGHITKLSKRDERLLIRTLHCVRKQDGYSTLKMVKLYSCVTSIHEITIDRLLQVSNNKKKIETAYEIWKGHKKCCDIVLWSSRICLLDAKHFIQKTDQINQQKAPESLVW